MQAGRAEFERLSPPGAALAFVHGTESPRLSAMGVEDAARGNPVSPGTIFQIASLTKPFTAIVVLALAEAGRLRLDERAAQWLDWLPAAYAPVTIRQLLNHTSGVVLDVRRQNVDELDIDEFRRRFVAAPPVFSPGERWEYANAGYTLLSLIAEQVSGRSFAELLHAFIFRPLRMRRTRYRGPLSKAPGRATGYDWVENRWVEAPPVYSGFGNTGIETTIADLVRFAQGLHQRRMLSRASYVDMLTPGRLRSGAPLEFPFRGALVGYGLGWFLGRVCGEPVAFHGGTIAGFSSMLQWFPARNFSVAALANGKSHPDRLGVAEKIAASAATAKALGCAPNPAHAGRAE